MDRHRTKHSTNVEAQLEVIKILEKIAQGKRMETVILTAVVAILIIVAFMYSDL